MMCPTCLTWMSLSLWCYITVVNDPIIHVYVSELTSPGAPDVLSAVCHTPWQGHPFPSSSHLPLTGSFSWLERKQAHMLDMFNSKWQVSQSRVVVSTFLRSENEKKANKSKTTTGTVHLCTWDTNHLHWSSALLSVSQLLSSTAPFPQL